MKTRARIIKTAKNCFLSPGVRMEYLKKSASQYLFHHREGGCSLFVVRALVWEDNIEIEFSCNTHKFGKIVGKDVVAGRFQTEQGDIVARFDGRVLTVNHPVEWAK